MEDELTGNFCFKSNMWGELILYVEIEYQNVEYIKYYRKARSYDLLKLNLGKL